MDNKEEDRAAIDPSVYLGKLHGKYELEKIASTDVRKSIENDAFRWS